jgi:hypothetical protein
VLSGDYGRACAVADFAGLIDVGAGAAIVLGDYPAPTVWLPERNAFLRWIAADSDDAILRHAGAVLADLDTKWEEVGAWTTTGPAVLMDAALAGSDLDVEENIEGMAPRSAAVALPPGRHRVQACYAEREDDGVALMIVRLLPGETMS